MEKMYRVTYYQWYFDRYGDKEFELMNHWVTEGSLRNLNQDDRVDDLVIHEVCEGEVPF